MQKIEINFNDPRDLMENLWSKLSDLGYSAMFFGVEHPDYGVAGMAAGSNSNKPTKMTEKFGGEFQKLLHLTQSGELDKEYNLMSAAAKLDKLPNDDKLSFLNELVNNRARRLFPNIKGQWLLLEDLDNVMVAGKASDDVLSNKNLERVRQTLKVGVDT